MKGNFVLPTFYKNGNEISFNLGSLSTIIIGLIAAIGLFYSQPELFANNYVTFVTVYTAPQIIDGVITAGTRYKNKSSNEGVSTEETVDKLDEVEQPTEDETQFEVQ